MINKLERQRLMRQMADQPSCEWAILARCAAGLVVLVLIAAIGAGAPAGDGAANKTAVQFSPPTNNVGSAHAHRREVFEQRRHRYVVDHLTAAPTELAPRLLPIAQR